MAATYSSLVGLAVGGKYEIRRILGVGGMGVVCEAVHLDLGKKVAIKLIDKSMKESELIVARFRSEARALGQIQSEHIVDVFDVGADARVGLYMVMEHLPGEDLQTRLERDKRLDLTTGVMIGHQIARGLEKAHAARVIHRDLKPANVFLTTRDHGGLLVKLLDFGVSKLLGDAGGARITGSGAPIGTPLYMSPEQAEGKDDTDARADIWSLGAVMYEALAGTPPFPDRGSYHGTIVGILTSRPKLLHDAAPWVPPELAKVIDAMLVHDRDQRIKDAATVTKRLLEAFPSVLPDGTGRHTAVIVQHASPAVDTTGDTEIFTSAEFHKAKGERGSSGPPDPEDSKRTVPNVSSSPGVDPEALRTAAATPVEMNRDSGDSFRGSAPPGSSSPSVPSSGGLREPISGGGPKTVPLAAPSSSAQGVAMPGTPPVIEPLPLSEKAPDTTRDEDLALRAERRRWVTIALLAACIVGVAVIAYFAGRRSTPSDVASPTAPTATTTAPTTATAPSAGAASGATSTASAAATAATTEEATPAAPPSAAPGAPTATEASATPSASAAPPVNIVPGPRPHGGRRLFKPRAATGQPTATATGQEGPSPEPKAPEAKPEGPPAESP